MFDAQSPNFRAWLDLWLTVQINRSTDQQINKDFLAVDIAVN